MWNVEDHHFKTFSIMVHSKVGKGDMLGSRKGVKAGDHKLTNSSGRIKTCRQTCKYRGIKGLLEVQVLAELGNDLRCVRKSFLPLR